MASSTRNVINDWKRLWQLVSGIHHETPENTVLEELLNVSQELQDGLLQFRAMNSSKTELELLLKEKKQEKLLPFTLRLQALLDLETKQCWEILCYYLANEYRGSASTLATFILTESQMEKLLDDIWGYYTLQRMIVLKIVKNLLMYYKDPLHPYHREYQKIVDKLTLSRLLESYTNQLEHLINEVPPTKLTAGEFFNYQAKLLIWSERNAREINETAHILLVIFEHTEIDMKQLQRLFNCFKQHSFGKQQRYKEAGNSGHQELVTRVVYSEIVLFLKCIDFVDAKKVFDTSEEIKQKLENDISTMCHNPENGPVLFAWMIVNFRCCNSAEQEESMFKYSQFGKRAVHLNCFSYLRELVSHPMFKDDSLVSRIARKTIYNQLNYMCDIFDGDGSCAKHPYIYELLCELVSSPTLAREFCSREEGGVRSLYQTLLEVFPIDFQHLSMLAAALTNGGMASYVKSQLESLPILTDLYDENSFCLKSVSQDEYVLWEDFTPFKNIDFTIAKGTSAVVMERPQGLCVHFRVSVNYFNVLHNEINCLLTETVQLHSDFHSSARMKRVNAGLRYLEAALRHAKTLTAISVDMVHPTEMCIDLLNKFKIVQLPPLDLMANCLNICTALLPLVDAEIFTRVINLNILPVITNTTIADYRKYSLGVCFDSQLVGAYLVDVEKKLERYDFLLAYLSFLRTFTKLQKPHLVKVEIPGLIFLLREVFCHMHAWRFHTKAEQNKIYAEIMGFICDILDSVGPVTDKNKQHHDREQRLLRDICVYSLLNLENGLVLLRFIAVGNAYLQHTMELESNWMLQQTSGLMLLVRLSMRILMQLLRLKTTVFASSELSPLEALIYTQPKQRDTLRIIPVVTSYMNNIFDRWLPILSCRLLKRIALEFNMSLLACLDMEPDQIRLTFLQKLPDELESDSLKLAILELVEACIEKQPGVTEAFFKVDFSNERGGIFRKENDLEIAESILTFMEDYLDAVEKEPTTVQNALPSRIVNIFHSLWKNNMQILVKDLTERPKFWQQICNPLLCDLVANVRAYTQLLNILSIEIYCSHDEAASAELNTLVLKFFDPPQFKIWLDHVFNMPKQPALLQSSEYDVFNDEPPEWLCQLQAFKDFLTIVLHKQPHFVDIPHDSLKLLAERCFRVLVDRASYVSDLRPFIILSEMYLTVLLSFKHAYTKSSDEDRVMLELLIELIGRVASCYEDLLDRSKEACLTIATKCADLLAAELRQDFKAALSFLNSAVSIICIELQNLEHSVNSEVRNETRSADKLSTASSLVLTLNLFRAIAVIFHNDGPGNWDSPFITNKVCQRLLSCTNSILQLYAQHHLSAELLDVLIIFAKGNCSNEFLYCDVGDYLWIKLLPPSELLQASYNVGVPKKEAWTVSKWWPIYARGIELVTVLFEKNRNHFLKDVIQFVGIHEEYLMDSLLLAKQSLEPAAIRLIKAAMMLISSLVHFEKQWRLDHSQSLFNIMRCVQILMGHSISLFHQPKNLKILIDGRRNQLNILQTAENDGVTDDLVTALNHLTEIIILCVRSLQQFSPKLIELICDFEFLASKWEPIFEIHFGAPKLDENAVTLSFGTVLSIVGVYTKALNLQNYAFHEVPLNQLPGRSDQSQAAGSGENSAETTANKNATEQHTFSKSLSIASVSSTGYTASNELLSTLDGGLCLLALESVLSLAASQSLLALKNTHLLPREKQLIRREISTELITYHEFVRKKVLVDYREHKAIWHRRKHGQKLMQHTATESNVNSQSASTSSLAARTAARQPASNSMRVNVVRRLHLQQQHARTPPGSTGEFDMTEVISPIGQASSHDPPAVSSTPNSRRSGDAEMHDSEDNAYEEQDTEDIQYFPPDDANFCPLSHVQLVEEDYLHFMSILFTVICQSD